MKTLTMTAYNRPDYLAQTLASVAKNDFSGYDKMFFGIEPGNIEVQRLCKAPGFLPTQKHVNPKVLGVANNPYMTLKRAFKSGSKLNIYLEDDVLFSPDITKLADWYGKLPNVNDYLCLGFFRKQTLGDLGLVQEEYDTNMFSALGLVMTDYQWENYFAPNWFKDPRGWDWSIKGFMEKSGKPMLVPGVSRSYHIGRERATHYVPAMHDKVHVPVKWNQESEKNNYSLQKSAMKQNKGANKSGIAVAIAYRRNGNRPDNILKLCIRSWLQQSIEPDAIIVADGSLQPVDFSEFDTPKLIHAHVPFDGDFNLSFLRNVGARLAVDSGADYIQIMDNDVFPSKETHLAECLNKMRTCDMVMPYVANSPKTITSFNSVKDAGYQTFVNQKFDLGVIQRYSYSTMFMKSKVPAATRGWLEKCRVWGAEDDCFISMAMQNGFRATRMAQPILVHSHHEVDTKKQAKSGKAYENNVRILEDVRKRKITVADMPKDWGLANTPRYT